MTNRGIGTILSALILCLVMPSVAKSWLSPVDNTRILDFQEDSNSDSMTEGVALNKLGTMKYYECGTLIRGFPQIVGRYSSKLFPCIKLYFVDIGTTIRYEMIQDPYTRILFNTCDSSVYHFGGDTFRFSQVMKGSLRNGLQEETLIKLIHFYLNSLSVGDSYYLLNSLDDFEEICNRYFADGQELQAEFYTPEESRQDGLTVEKIVSPLEFIRELNSTRINLFTWEGEFGKIEYWSFVITEEYIQIAAYHEIVKGIGPHNPLP